MVCISIGSIYLLLMTRPVRAEFVISVYGGVASTMDSDVRLLQPGGTNLKFDEVSWTDKSFVSPIYYGLRLTYWTEKAPTWGVAIDFTHPKMHAKLEETVTVTGTRAGVPVNNREPLRNTFGDLEFSHGHNLLTLNALHRWFPAGERNKTFLGRVQPYVGFGAGVAIPHAEVGTGGVITYEYQQVGPALQGLVGVSFDLIKHVAIFPEYKISYANMSVELADGGSLQVDPWTHHFALGISYIF